MSKGCKLSSLVCALTYQSIGRDHTNVPCSRVLRSEDCTDDSFVHPLLVLIVEGNAEC